MSTEEEPQERDINPIRHIAESLAESDYDPARYGVDLNELLEWVNEYLDSFFVEIQNRPAPMIGKQDLSIVLLTGFEVGMEYQRKYGYIGEEG